MEYNILRAETIYWRNQEVRAKLQSPYDMQVAIDLWKPEPFARDPLQEYNVNGKAPLPDLLRTGSIAWLMSERFLELLRNAGVQFEGFPVKLYDRKSRELVPKHYQLFHLLQVQPVIDLQRSNISRGDHIDQIELIPYGEDGPVMTRDSFMASLVFVREDLREQIIAAEFTGCWWLTIEDYLNLKRSLR